MHYKVSIAPLIHHSNRISFNKLIEVRFIRKISNFKHIIINRGENSHKIVKQENMRDKNMQHQQTRMLELIFI